MFDSAQKWLKLIITGLGLVGFVWMYIILFRGDWSETNQPTENFLNLASMLTGLVSGVVAAMFGVSVPRGGGAGVGGSRLAAMGAWISPIDATTLKQWLAIAYVIGYLAMAIWAMIIWVGPPDEHRPQLIDGLATVAAGIVVAVIAGFLGSSRK